MRSLTLLLKYACPTLFFSLVLLPVTGLAGDYNFESQAECANHMTRSKQAADEALKKVDYMSHHPQWENLSRASELFSSFKGGGATTRSCEDRSCVLTVQPASCSILTLGEEARQNAWPVVAQYIKQADTSVLDLGETSVAQSKYELKCAYEGDASSSWETIFGNNQCTTGAR